MINIKYRKEKEDAGDERVEGHRRAQGPLIPGGVEALEELGKHRVAEEPEEHVTEPYPWGEGSPHPRTGEELRPSGGGGMVRCGEPAEG